MAASTTRRSATSRSLPAGKADETPYTVDNRTVAQPLVIHPFRGDAADSEAIR